MTIDRTAFLARTAHDRAHLNRLSVPEFGVVHIQIKGQGGSKSKCYRDQSSTTTAVAPGDGVDTFHFAPGPQYAEATWTADATLNDNVQVVYKLHNPHLAIKEAKIEIFSRFSEDPVWSRTLTDDERLHGEHTLRFNNQDDWDGKIDAHQDFPDRFLTAEFSPYKLKLTITGDGINTSPTAWTYFHVVVSKLELEYGPRTLLPVQPANLEGGIHTETYDNLIAQGAKPPAQGAMVKVILDSDVFTVGGDDMFGNALYDRLETLWGDGPQIPIFCKVWVKSSDDRDVVCPKALGRTRFMWDWESTSADHATNFTTKAQDYLSEKSKPKGKNCHSKRGGKRGADTAAKPGATVFPAQAPNGTFPFEVEVIDTKRKWASNSYAGNSGAEGAKTGVMFRPSRMAGDRYALRVFVNQVYDRKKLFKLNQTEAEGKDIAWPDALKTVSGDFEIWRRVNVRRYVKKSNSVAETLNLQTIADFYKTAFLDLKDVTGGAIQIVGETAWNNRVAAAIAGLGIFESRMILPDSGADNQYSRGGAGVYLRTRAGYEAQLVAEGHAQADIDSFMDDPSNGVADDDDYSSTAKYAVGKPVTQAGFDPDAHAGSGCTIFHCDAIQSIPNSLLGYACQISNANGNRCGFLLCATNADHGASDNIENTATHEFGHHFFLPHTTDAGEKKNYKAHDSSITTCIMSYNAPIEFCGFCQLRLRGWDKRALKPKPSANSKS